MANTLTKMILNAAEQLFNFEEFVAQVKNSISNGFMRVESRIYKSLHNIQRYTLRLIIDALLLLASLVLGIIGVILVLQKYIPLEYVFLGFSAIGILFFLFRNARIVRK